MQGRNDLLWASRKEKPPFGPPLGLPGPGAQGYHRAQHPLSIPGSAFLGAASFSGALPMQGTPPPLGSLPPLSSAADENLCVPKFHPSSQNGV